MKSCFLLFMWSVRQSLALPGGPASCSTGGGLGGFHLIRPPSANVGSGAIGNGGFELLFGDDALVDGDDNVVEATEMLELRANSGFFRGFLIRVSGGGLSDTTSLLVRTDDNTQNLGLCDNMGVGSLAHTGREDKTSIAGAFMFPEDESSSEDLIVEVTVVVTNSADEGSLWYYSNFTVRVDGSDLPVSAAPSATTPSPTITQPTAPVAPVVPPTAPVAPVVPPTAPVAPVVPPTAPVTSAPTEAPDTDAPTNLPTDMSMSFSTRFLEEILKQSNQRVKSLNDNQVLDDRKEHFRRGRRRYG